LIYISDKIKNLIKQSKKNPSEKNLSEIEKEIKNDDEIELEIHGKTHFTIALFSIYQDVSKGKLNFNDEYFFQNYVSLIL
jgi:hypothetical protein